MCKCVPRTADFQTPDDDQPSCGTILVPCPTTANYAAQSQFEDVTQRESQSAMGYPPGARLPFAVVSPCASQTAIAKDLLTRPRVRQSHWARPRRRQAPCWLAVVHRLHHKTRGSHASPKNASGGGAPDRRGRLLREYRPVHRLHLSHAPLHPGGPRCSCVDLHRQLGYVRVICPQAPERRRAARRGASAFS